MEKLNELSELAQAMMDAETRKEAFAIGEKFTLACSPETILAIADAFRALEQRAEAAEAKLKTKEQELAQYVECFEAEAARADRNHAKLAELEQQKPYGYVHNLVNPPGGGVAASIFKEESRHYGRPVFTRPAVSLAEMVPDEDEVERIYSIYCTPTLGSKNALRHIRKEILRNIEETQNK